jgi:hypothetical protein
MEETKVNHNRGVSISIDPPKCCTPNCKNTSIVCCQKHSKFLCNSCTTYIHASCETQVFSDPEWLTEDLNIVETRLNRILDYINSNHLDDEIEDYLQDIKEIQTMIESYKTEICEAIEKKQIQKYFDLKSKSKT